MYQLKIPKDRIAVLIGKSGQIKKQIEDDTQTKIEVDSEEGDVFLSGKDAIGLFNAREVIKAIGRGFNPEIAQLLLRGEYVFEMINLADYAGKSKTTMMRLKGRVIGKEGKARRNVEELTECYISVYGKTVCLIGEPENASIARKALESLLNGSPHSSVYKWLEKKKRDMKLRGFETTKSETL